MSNYPGKSAIIYDCDSDADYLWKETSFKKLALPNILQTFINLRDVFPMERIKRAPKSMKDMLEILNLTFEGREHKGVDDAYN